MADSTSFRPDDFPGLVHQHLGAILSGFGFEEDDRVPHSITYESATMLLIFSFDRGEVHAALEPLPTEQNDDPDYVALPALFVFLELNAPTDRLFLNVDSPARLEADLIKCAGFLPGAEAYLRGRIVDYGPIWDRIDAGTLFIG